MQILYEECVKAVAGSYHGGLNGLWCLSLSWTASLEPPIHFDPLSVRKSIASLRGALEFLVSSLPILVIVLKATPKRSLDPMSAIGPARIRYVVMTYIFLNTF